MKKRYLFMGIVLGILLLGGGIVGYGQFRDQEMMQRMAEQKIVFMCINEQFQDNYQLSGYVIDDSGDQYIFDVTDAFRDGDHRWFIEHDKNTLYDYLCSHMEEYDKTPLLNADQLHDCYTYLNMIDPEAEFIEKMVTKYYGPVNLYGIRPSDDGEREFILLRKCGGWLGYNSDEYAQRIMEIIGKDTWMRGLPDGGVPGQGTAL